MIMAKINWLTTHTTMAAIMILRYRLIIPAMRRYEANKATLNPRTARQQTGPPVYWIYGPKLVSGSRSNHDGRAMLTLPNGIIFSFGKQAAVSPCPHRVSEIVILSITNLTLADQGIDSRATAIPAYANVNSELASAAQSSIHGKRLLLIRT